jgi:hypothetical protein
MRRTPRALHPPWESPELARFNRCGQLSARLPSLQSTHEATLDVVDLADLKRRALELS